MRSAADKPALAAADAAYQQSFDQWKTGLVEDLKQEWLPLAGLFWLKPGENSFGTDPKNAIVFPKGPAQAGSFVLQGKSVTARFDQSANATIAGKSVTRRRTSAGYIWPSDGRRNREPAVARHSARRACRYPPEGRRQRRRAQVSADLCSFRSICRIG